MDSCHVHEHCDGCPDKIVCRCLKVTEDQIVRMVERLELRTVRDLRKYTGAGDGCTCCHGQLEAIIERVHCSVEAVA